MKFFIKYFFSKCAQIRMKMWDWSHLPKKSLMENFIFCAVYRAIGRNLLKDKQLKSRFLSFLGRLISLTAKISFFLKIAISFLIRTAE